MKIFLGILAGLGIWLICLMAGMSLLYDWPSSFGNMLFFVTPALLLIIWFLTFRRVRAGASEFMVGLCGTLAMATLVSSLCGAVLST
jgi:hypothetical protein